MCLLQLFNIYLSNIHLLLYIFTFKYILFWVSLYYGWGFPGGPSAGDVRDAGSMPGLGRSPGGQHGNPLQYSCLENPMDRGGWSTGLQRVGHNWSHLVCTYIIVINFSIKLNILYIIAFNYLYKVFAFVHSIHSTTVINIKSK